VAGADLVVGGVRTVGRGAVRLVVLALTVLLVAGGLVAAPVVLDPGGSTATAAPSGSSPADAVYLCSGLGGIYNSSGAAEPAAYGRVRVPAGQVLSLNLTVTV